MVRTIVSGHSNRVFEPCRASLRAKVSNYKAHAKIRGLVWGLSTDQACDMLASRCHYCGDQPSRPFNSMRCRSRSDKSKDRLVCRELVESATILINGIDRKDNGVGYLPTNCVPCCTTCNSAKMASGYEDFMLWLARVSAFRRVG